MLVRIGILLAKGVPLRVLITVAVLLGIEIVLAVVLVVSGAFNVSALTAERGPMRLLLESVRERSIETRSGQEPEPDLSGASIAVGAADYERLCAVCHGAPGIPRSEIGRGLNPDPPDLARSLRDASPKEIIWIVRNGIKMTGMPAFSRTVRDERLLGLIAISKRLPGMSPEEFRVLADQGRAEAR